MCGVIYFFKTVLPAFARCLFLGLLRASLGPLPGLCGDRVGWSAGVVRVRQLFAFAVFCGPSGSKSAALRAYTCAGLYLG